MIPLPAVSELAKSYTGFLFDLDGTLLDSMHAWVEADRNFLGKRGFEVTPDYTEFVKTNSAEKSAVYTIERFGLDMTPDEVISEWLDFVKEEYAHHIKLKDGAAEFLRQAKEAGIRLGAATALDEGNALSALKNNGIFGYFGKVYTLSEHDLVSDITSSKTEPMFYHAAARACGIGDEPSRILVFDDVPHALKAARDGGYKTCGVYDKVGTGDIGELDFCNYRILSFPIS